MPRRFTTVADDASALLVRSGLVTTSALEEAHVRMVADGGTLSEHLVAAGAITDEALTELYRTSLNLAVVNPNALARLSVRVVATVPADLAIELRVIPVALDGEQDLTLAMSDPLDRHAFDEIAFVTGMRVVRAVATQMQIAWCLAHYYGHVSPLGQRLLQVAPASPAPEPAPASPPRVRGLTGQVDALRHRAKAPVTGPFDAIRPMSGPIVLAPASAPTPVVAPAPAAEPAPTLDAVPERPRARSISGEIRVPPARAASILPPEETPFEDDEPSVKIEMPVRRRKAKTDPPELAARAGEVRPAAPLLRTVDSGPHIILADDALGAPAPAPSPAEDEAVTLRGDGRAPGSRDTDSQPILLERKRPDEPRAAEADDEVVVLEAKKVRPPAAARGDRHTQVGLGVVAAATRTGDEPGDRTSVDTPVAPAVGDDTDETLAAPPAPVLVGTPPTPHPDLDDEDDDVDDDDPGRGRTTAVMSVVELDDAIPARSAEVVPGHLAPRRREVIHTAHDALDDGWGPPGTTIPPPLLGAAPGTDDDAGSDRIPLDSFDAAPLLISAPAAAPAPAAPAPARAAPSARESDDATSRLLALIRQLEHAESRDDVVGLLIDHLVHTHHRAGFFVIRPGAIKGSIELSVFAVSPRPALLPYGTLPLERPSTLRDVVGARVPYRGPTPDNLSRAFLASALGACPAEILLVPITVRDRVVGVLFGDLRKTHTFDDQLTLAARAAGQALERVLKSRRA